MSVELKPELEDRLRNLAERRSRTLPDLVEEAVTSYLEALDDEPTAIVRATARLIPRVWPREDFSDWSPPDAR